MESLLPIENCAGVDAATLRQLAHEIGQYHSLGQVIGWAIAHVPRAVETVIAQDECSRDVVVAWRAGLYLVFDANSLGVVHSASVWATRPTARQLLDARISRGWQPTPTATREGLRVLGFAACLEARAA
jgi:hypothetical protein